MLERMGAPQGEQVGTRHSAGWGKLVLLIGIALVAMLASAVPAQASFHEIYIKEVYPGSAAAPDSGYVEVQMWAALQEQVGGHGITLYGSTGAQIDANGGANGNTLEFSAALTPQSKNQQTILIGDTGVNAAFGVTPDLSNAAFNIPASGGAACWADTIDCVAWGNYSHAAPPTVGTPVDSGGIPDGMAIKRKITGGSCTNLLDSTDDTNNSASDFADASPSPVAYTTEPNPPACTPPNPPPTVTINSKPANPTQATSASFTFTSNPAGATFECRVDTEEFASCVSGVNYPGPLTEASHTFQVKATNGNGTGTPASYTWTIDKTAPNTTISAMPANPSPGKTSLFRYTSPETGSTFECKLAPTQASFSDCTTQPKIYSNLADGNYTFEVQAKDAAGNTDASPAVYEWKVDNSLADTEPPDTAILTKPANPSTSGDAAFTYSSTEPESTFKCKLDGGGFEACDPGGKSYSGAGRWRPHLPGRRDRQLRKRRQIAGRIQLGSLESDPTSATAAPAASRPEPDPGHDDHDEAGSDDPGPHADLQVPLEHRRRRLFLQGRQGRVQSLFLSIHDQDPDLRRPLGPGSGYRRWRHGPDAGEEQLQGRQTEEEKEEMRLRRFGLTIGIVAATAMIPSSAFATFHEVSIREVFPGDSTNADAEYVELQAYSPGQNLVQGHIVRFYNAGGH